MSLEQPAGRASDQERDLAATVVQQAFADGRLDADEFDERINSVYAAKTRNDLALLTQDQCPVSEVALAIAVFRCVHRGGAGAASMLSHRGRSCAAVRCVPGRR